jgi:hypothetical protein
MRVLLFPTIFALALLGTLAWKLWPELSRPTRLDPAFQVPSLRTRVASGGQAL